jgi:hypothetical protein
MRPKQSYASRTATYVVTARSSTPNEIGWLHALLRHEGRIQRYGNRSKVARLPKCKRARTTLHARESTDGSVAQPLPLLRLHGHLRTVGAICGGLLGIQLCADGDVLRISALRRVVYANGNG